jgi:hypothetical protein
MNGMRLLSNLVVKGWLIKVEMRGEGGRYIRNLVFQRRLYYLTMDLMDILRGQGYLDLFLGVWLLGMLPLVEVPRGR